MRTWAVKPDFPPQGHPGIGVPPQRGLPTSRLMATTVKLKGSSPGPGENSGAFFTQQRGAAQEEKR
jgi:hypothetical protein